MHIDHLPWTVSVPMENAVEIKNTTPNYKVPTTKVR